MGIFDIFKKKPKQKKTSVQNLFFKSNKAAYEYSQKFFSPSILENKALVLGIVYLIGPDKKSAYVRCTFEINNKQTEILVVAFFDDFDHSINVGDFVYVGINDLGQVFKFQDLISSIEKGDLEGGRHFAVWYDPFIKPAYLFALVAGQLSHVGDEFTTMSGRKVALEIYTEAHNITRCDHAMQSLKRSMKWDEERFGLEYDLDIYMIVAVDDFNMGAMENKGLNVFNSKLVFASPDTATDIDYINIEAVIGHEYFHNWTGNRVTCRDWFQLSLKEGLTVFRDQEFTADLHSRSVKRI